MTPTDLLGAIRALGDVRLVDGQLEIAAPRGALTPELRTEIVWQKQELVAALEAEAATAAQLVAVWRPPGPACRHPHVVIRDGVAECQRCDMRRPLRPADEADAPPPEAETAEQLEADGPDIIASLTERGITVRLGDDGRPLVGPVELVDEADRALLAAHRDAVVAALRAATANDGVGTSEVVPGTDEVESGASQVVRGPDEVPGYPGRAGIGVAVVPGELTGDGTASRPHLVPEAPTTATGGPVPGQEGRPASPGAEPTGGSEPGTASLPPSAALHEPDHLHVTAGTQAIDLERVLVTTTSEWERVKADVFAEPVLGLDTEATGLDPFTSRLRLVQLAARGRVYVVDAFRFDPRALQRLLDGANRLVGHNLKFDLRMLMAAGLQLPADIGQRLSDTMLGAQLLGAGLRGERYRLADLTQRYLGVELDKAEQTSDWSGDLSDEQLAYAARDAAVLLPLRGRLRAELERAELGEVAGIESRTLPAVAWLEQSGAPFDQAAWLGLAEIAEERRRRLEHELDAMAPSDSPLLPLAGMVESPSRWNSPAQVLKLLASRGVVLPNTRDETLHEHHDDDPLIPLLLEHRDAAKQSGAFGREFLRFVHPVTGRIHADFFQLGSEAGRASCRSPNLQQIPNAAEYRACFRAPEGRVLVGADYSQIEPRISAEISGEERLLAAYRERRDVYRQVASELGVERGVAKTIVLGALYGLGARGLARRLKADAGIEMAEEQARSYLDAFFAGYPALDRWRRGRRTDGPATTRTLSGRRRLNVENYTQKINTPIQGLAADVFKLAMALLHESRDTVPSAGLVLSVHDELVLEVGEAEAEVARRWLADCMKRAGEQYLRRVPVVVEAGTGLTWAETKKTATPVEEDDEWAA